jgi:hypothetical protein
VTPGLAVGDSVGEGAWASGLCLLLVLVAGAWVLRGVLRGRPEAVPSSAPAAVAPPEREEVPR